MSWQKRFITTLLILSSLKSGAQASLNSLEKPTKGLEEIVIKEGEKAPFSGALVPENRYQWYQIQVADLGICKDYRKLLENTCYTQPEPQPMLWPAAVTFAVGFLAGFALAK